MKLNPEKWLAERAARSWTAGIGKRNDLQGKLRSTPRRHCIGTRLEFFFILCHIKQLEVMVVMIMRIFACSDKDTNLQHVPICIVQLPLYFFTPSAKPHHETFPPASQQTSPIFSILTVKDRLGRQSASNMISLFVNIKEILFLAA